MDTLGLYLSSSRVTDKPEIPFTRIDTKEVMEKVETMHVANQTAEGAHTKRADDRGDIRESGDTKENVIDVGTKPEITYEDFAKLWFRVGETIRCEAVPKFKRLLCFQIEIGDQACQIINGIKTCYSPGEMVDKEITVATNLRSARLVGMLSEEMLLCAAGADGGLAPMRPEKDMLTGAEIC